MFSMTPWKSLLAAAVAVQFLTQSPAYGQSTGNPFAGGKQCFANPYYANEILTDAVPNIKDAALADAAKKVADVGTFFWLDAASKVPMMDSFLTNISDSGSQVLGCFVVYDLPERDCSAAASNGEYSLADNGEANYKAYIDSITKIAKAHTDNDIVLVIEPDSLANLVTNINVDKCAKAADAYKALVTYAIQQLNLPNVWMYLDLGHAGWIGWDANLQPAADLMSGLVKNASSPGSVRGIATNVANYNAWTGDCANYTSGDKNCNEKLYVDAIAPLLKNGGFDAHFITDQGRSGVQPTKQQEWGHWCNVKDAGFGTRPTDNTGDDLEDAFVWIKPGGESDGTSVTSAARYDWHCGESDALQPAPEVE